EMLYTEIAKNADLRTSIATYLRARGYVTDMDLGSPEADGMSLDFPQGTAAMPTEGTDQYSTRSATQFQPRSTLGLNTESDNRVTPNPLVAQPATPAKSVAARSALAE